MGWTRSTAKSGWMVAYQDLTTADGATTDVDSSAIDFLTPGKNFLVGIYKAATISGAVDLDVLASFASGGTYAVLKADILSNVAATAGFSCANYAVNTNGSAPFLKIRIDPDTATGGQVARIYLMQDDLGGAT